MRSKLGVSGAGQNRTAVLKVFQNASTCIGPVSLIFTCSEKVNHQSTGGVAALHHRLYMLGLTQDATARLLPDELSHGNYRTSYPVTLQAARATGSSALSFPTAPPKRLTTLSAVIVGLV